MSVPLISFSNDTVYDHIYLFIYDLFNATLSSWDYIALNDSMIRK
jgi:hypothetical protein